MGSVKGIEPDMFYITCREIKLQTHHNYHHLFPINDREHGAPFVSFFIKIQRNNDNFYLSNDCSKLFEIIKGRILKRSTGYNVKENQKGMNVVGEFELLDQNTYEDIRFFEYKIKNDMFYFDDDRLLNIITEDDINTLCEI